MRILTSLTYYYPNISGLSLHAQMISEALVKKGNKVTVLCMQHERALKSEEILNGVKIHRAKTIFKISKGFLSYDFIIKSLREVKNTDVVILHLPQFEGVFPAVFAKILGKRIIVFYHCDVVLPSGILNKIIEKLLWFSNYLTLSLSDKILHSTKDFVENSEMLKKFLNKIDFIYPPIKSYKANKRTIVLLKKRIGDGFYKVGFMGRLAADKGIEYLLEAIPIIKSKIQNAKFKILLAGPIEPVGEEGYKKKISSLVEKYKDYVVFLGKLRDEEMGSFYSILDLLVVPSVNSTESFGTVQVEAMLAGTPVVVSDLPGVRVPVTLTGMGRVFSVKNKQELATAVVEVLKNKERYRKDRKIIVKEFSFNNTVNVYEKFCKKFG